MTKIPISFWTKEKITVNVWLEKNNLYFGGFLFILILNI